MRHAGRVISLAVSAMLFTPGQARAQQSDAAGAEALFRRGLALMAKGDVAEACEALSESARLELAGGTLFRLAQCREAEGKTASAWAVYQEALSEALKRDNAEKAQEVRAHIAHLEPRLVRLRVIVPTAVRALDDVVVSRNGTTLGPPAWGVALPIDPGRVEVEIQAKGMRPAAVSVVVHEGDGVVELQIPELEAVPAPPNPTTSAVAAPMAAPIRSAPTPISTTRSEPGRGSLLRTLGWVTVGSSAVGFAASLGLYLQSSSLVREATPSCPNGCDAKGHALYESARDNYWASVGTGIAGAALVGLGTFLVWYAPNGSTTATVGPSQVQLRQSF